MYKQDNAGAPIKKLDTPSTFSDRNIFMKLAKDPSNEMFNTGEESISGLNSNHTGDKKKPLKGKKALGTENMSYEEKLAYYEKQKKTRSPKNSNISMGMGSGYTTLNKGD